MNHRYLRCVILILKIIVECAKLRNQHHALVDDGAAGQGTNIGIGILFFKCSAQDIEPAVEFNAMLDSIGTGNKALPDAGHGSACACSQQFWMAGDAAPCDYRKTLRISQFFKDAACLTGSDFIVRQKEHADAIVAGIAEMNVMILGPPGKKPVRQLRQYADAVACGSRGVASGTVRKTLYNRKSIRHRAVRSPFAQINHRTHAAGFMFHSWIIQRIGSCHGSSLHSLLICFKKPGCKIGQFQPFIHCSLLQLMMGFRLCQSILFHQQSLCLMDDLFFIIRSAREAHMMKLNQHIYGAGQLSL